MLPYLRRLFRSRPAPFLTGMPVALLLAIVVMAPVRAEPPGTVPALIESLESIDTFAAEFEQRRLSARGEVTRELGGHFAIARPDRFHWLYETPYVQELTARDGILWVYEPDLRQATRSKLDAGNAAPIAILMGDRPIDDVFEIRALEPDDGMTWFALRPKEEAGDFREVLLGLDDAGLKEMRFIDQLDQTTHVVFHQRRFGEPVDEDRFVFEPPEGVDVVEARQPPQMP
ncbi:MAG: outer membrane lipoprotein chaperone LolA [Pseudomonadota bacterium]